MTTRLEHDLHLSDKTHLIKSSQSFGSKIDWLSNCDEDTLHVHLILYSSSKALGLVIDIERCLERPTGVEVLTSGLRGGASEAAAAGRFGGGLERDGDGAMEQDDGGAWRSGLSSWSLASSSAEHAGNQASPAQLR